MKTTKDFPEINSSIQIDVYQYPNPIQNSIFKIRYSKFKNNLIKTTIRYTANEAGYIRIKISDYSGRLVSIRDEGWKEPGQYQLALTSENLVSGVYFCTVESNGMRTDSQKITVMK